MAGHFSRDLPGNNVGKKRSQPTFGGAPLAAYLADRKAASIDLVGNLIRIPAQFRGDRRDSPKQINVETIFVSPCGLSRLIWLHFIPAFCRKTIPVRQRYTRKHVEL
jgi:hypothetical protein